MFGINLKHSLATVAVTAAVLGAAGPASAGTQQSGVLYNGHAGLGSNTARAAGVSDGTSNTVMFGERAAARLLPKVDDQVL
jgi:hypothetical protein